MLLLFISIPDDYDLDDKSYFPTSAGQNLIHVAILELEGQQVFAIDATLKYGVDRHPLDTLLSQFTLRGGRLPRIEVKRLAEGQQIHMPIAREAVKRAETYLGDAYDTAFDPENDALYCSELVHLCYLDADGKPLFPLHEIDLRTVPPARIRRGSPDGPQANPVRQGPDRSEYTIPRYWEQLCRLAGIALPQGDGIMPADIYASPLLRTVNVTLP